MWFGHPQKAKAFFFFFFLGLALGSDFGHP